MSATDAFRWRVVAAATFTQAGSAFVFLGVGTLTAFVRADLGLSATRTALLVTMVGLVPLFTMLPVGRLLDRHGERWLVAGGAALLGAGAVVAALSDTYVAIAALLLLAGTGYATSQPGGSSAVAGWFTGPRRGLAMGIRQTGLPLGGAAAAAILPTVADRIGWQGALAAAGAVAVAGGGLFAVTYRNHPHPVPDAEPLLRTARRLLRRPALHPVLWAGTIHVATQLAIVSHLLPYLRDRHDIPLAVGGICLFTSQMAGVAGRIALARWSDRYGAGRRLRPVAITLVATAVICGILAVAPTLSLPAAVALMLPFGFFAFGWYGPWVVQVADVAPDNTTGLTLALAMTGNQLGIVTGPPLFGALQDLTGGYVAPWLGFSAMLLFAAAKVAAARRRGEC